MPPIIAILQNTPLWVFALFAILMVLGIQALRERTLPIWRLLLTPVLFIGWGISSLALQSLSSPILLVVWPITAANRRYCGVGRDRRLFPGLDGPVCHDLSPPDRADPRCRATVSTLVAVTNTRRSSFPALANHPHLED